MQIGREQTKLTSGEAGRLLGVPEPVGGDYSFPALFGAIAINYSKPQTLSEIRKNYFNATFSRTNWHDVNVFLQNPVDYACVFIPRIGRGSENDIVLPEGWQTFDGAPLYLNRYLSQFCKSKVFINTEQHKIVAAICGSITPLWMQAFESMLWAIMPWFFSDKNQEDIAFFRKISVKNNDSDCSQAEEALIEYVNKAAEKIDWRDISLHTFLDGIGDRIRKAQIDQHKRNVTDEEYQIEMLLSNLSQHYNKLDEHKTILRALENQSPNEDDCVYRFFKQRGYMNVINANNQNIEYYVTVPLDQYDVEAVKRLFENQYSWVNSGYKSEVPYLYELFVNRRGIIRATAPFILSNMRLVKSVASTQYENDAMPNPHIYFFACDGENGRYYSQYAREGNWELGIEQSISAASNWNVGDGTVGNRMFNWLVSYNNKCIYVGDGSPIELDFLEEVTPDMKLVSYQEFKSMIDNLKILNTEGNEETNNG